MLPSIFSGLPEHLGLKYDQCITKLVVQVVGIIGELEKLKFVVVAAVLLFLLD